MQPRQQNYLPLITIFLLSCTLSLKAQCPISFVNPNQSLINVLLSTNCNATFDASTRVNIQGNCSLVYFKDLAMTLPYNGEPMFTGANLGQTIEVYVAAEDGNPNTALISPLKFSLKIQDAGAPTITCPANQAFVTTGVSCNYMITNGLKATAIDNCNGTVSLSWAASGQTTGAGTNSLDGKTFNVGRSFVTYSATDVSNNVSTCSFTIDVSETVAPTLISCPQNLTFDASMGTCERIVVNGLTPSYSDNCTLANSLVLGYEMSGATEKTGAISANNSIFKIGTTTVKYSAADAFGNSNTACSFTVSIKDIDMPQVICPADLSLNTSNDSCFTLISATNLTPLRLDNCGQNNLATSFSLSGATQSSIMPLQNIVNQRFAKGATSIVYTVSDAAGNSNTCAQRISISDKTKPKISCNSSHINAATSLSDCQKQVTLPQPTASDNCSTPASIVLSYSLKGAVNLAGNGTISPNQLFVPGMTTVTYRATDESSNFSECSYNVTVIEVPLVKPVIECRNDTIISAESGTCNTLILNGLAPKKASDNCTEMASLSLKISFSGATQLSDSTVSVSQGANGFRFNLGITKVRYILSDASQNSDTCFFNINVLDKQRPVITCGADISANATNGCSVKIAGLQPTATDNCGTGTLQFSYTLSGATPNPPQVIGIDAVDFKVGVTTVKYSVVDAGNNIDSCKFDVTVFEATPPTIVCPASLTVNTMDSTCTALLQDIATPQLADNCSAVGDLKWFFVATGATTSNGNQSINGRFFNYGKTIVTYGVSDFSNNTAQCSFSVQVKDATAPKIICPSNQIINSYDTTCYAVFSSPLITFSDNCSSILSYEISGATDKKGGGLFRNEVLNVGKNRVVYKATDKDGNSSQCTFDILVKDTLAPKIICPSDITLLVSGNTCAATIPALSPTMKDNCSQLDLSYSSIGVTNYVMQLGLLTAKNFDFGTSVVTYKVSDIQGNTATCAFNVVVQDLIKPVAKCRSGVMIALDKTGNAFMPATMYDNGSSDNCTAVKDLTFISSKEHFNCSNIGENSVLLTVKDMAGNVSTCASTITVKNGFPNLNVSLSTSSVGESYWGSTDGSVAVSVTGGQGAFDYVWNNGATEASQGDLNAGKYTVTVSDKVSRCAASASATVEAGPKMAITVGNIIGTVGSTALVPIRVQNFNKIKHLQFSLRLMNTSVGTIEGLQDFGVSSDSMMQSANNTIISFRKYFANANGMTLPNSTALFYIRIKLTAPIGTFSNLVFHAIPNILEAEQLLPSGVTKIPFNGISGSVGIGNGASTATISGKIMREDKVLLNDVKIYLSGTYNDSSTTKADGAFLYSLPLGAKSIVKATRNDEVRKGLTAIDAMLLQRHILGYESLGSDYKKLAADVNKSGSLTALDVSEIKRVILGYQPAFRNVNVWRFVPANFVFPIQTQNQVLPFPDSLLIPYLLDNQSDRDFIGVKTGDLNLSATANARNQSSILLTIENRAIESGEVFDISLKNEKNLQLGALQTGLRFDPSMLEFQGIKNTDLSNFNPLDINATQSENGALCLLWTAPQAQNIGENSNILTLQFKAKKPVENLKNYFSLDEKNLSALAYDKGEEKNIELVFKSQITDSEPLIVYPNPANDLFFVQTKANEKLTLLDVQGRIVVAIDTANSPISRIETATLPSGLYLLKIENEREVKLLNVVVVH